MLHREKNRTSLKRNATSTCQHWQRSGRPIVAVRGHFRHLQGASIKRNATSRKNRTSLKRKATSTCQHWQRSGRPIVAVRGHFRHLQGASTSHTLRYRISDYITCTITKLLPQSMRDSGASFALLRLFTRSVLYLL